MRIAYFLPNLHITGGARVALEIGKRLARKGHQFHIIIPRGRRRFPADSSIKIIECGFNFSTPLAALAQSLPTFITALPESDVIIASMPPNVIMANFAGVIRSIPTVNYMLGDDVHFFDDGTHIKSRLGQLIYRGVARFSLKLGNVIANSHWTAVRCVQSGGPRPLDIVPSGFDPNIFYPKKLRNGEPAKALTLVSVGRKERLKGLDTLIEGLNIAHHNGLAFELRLISQDELDLAQAKFKFSTLKPAGDDELADCYRSGDIFIHTSWFEGFGLPPLEAQACGLAVISTDSGGVREYLADGYNAVMVPPREPITLARALIKLAGDADLRRKLIAAGLESCRAFTWDIVADRMEKVLNRVAGRGS